MLLRTCTKPWCTGPKKYDVIQWILLLRVANLFTSHQNEMLHLTILKLKYLQIMKAIALDIRAFCPTRWTVRGDAIASIIENYQVLKQLWGESLDTKLEPDIKGRIIGEKLKCHSTG